MVFPFPASVFDVPDLHASCALAFSFPLESTPTSSAANPMRGVQSASMTANPIRDHDAKDIDKLYGIRSRSASKCDSGRLCKDSVLATSYSCLSTTIASTGLNCRVRNE